MSDITNKGNFSSSLGVVFSGTDVITIDTTSSATAIQETTVSSR